MPTYDNANPDDLSSAVSKIESFSPLVFAGEVRILNEQLARATQGQGFVLMGGDSAEAYTEFDVDTVRDSFRVMLQMALVLTFGSSLPIVKIGRMGGQFAKIREEGERNDPDTMVRAYHRSAQTLNILRAFSSGGYADISRLQAWNLDFVEQTPEGSKYRMFAQKVDESLRFMKAIGLNTQGPAFTKVDFFTAHECLNLPFEEALTRNDSTSGRHYGCSAHMLWLGEKTKDVDGAHMEFMEGLGNPLGIKISDKCTPEELIRLVETVNPQNIPGKLTVIVRMGAEKLRKNLPGLIRAVQRDGKSVLWISDPIHGNRREGSGGEVITRDFDAIRSELRAFFDVHDEMGSHPGGVHLDMTGEDVSEIAGGFGPGMRESVTNVSDKYDPRLNGEQSLELAFLIAERMRLRAGLPPLQPALAP